MRQLYTAIQQAFHEPAAASYRVIEGVVWTLILLSIGLFVVEVPHQFTWVSGDPTKESELDKVRLDHASAAIIVGSRDMIPQQADAITILTAFTIRRYLRQKDSHGHRVRPLYIVAEVLDAENVDHARTAGADEVIETNRLGFSLLAHAIVMPGRRRRDRELINGPDRVWRRHWNH